MSRKPNDWADLAGLSYQLQKTESRAEAMLLVALWGERDGWEPCAQHVVGRYRIDIAIPEAKLAIETDGFRFHSSNEALAADAERQNELVAEGWTPLRFPASQVYLRTGEVASRVVTEVRRRLRAKPSPAPRQPSPPPSPPETPERRPTPEETARGAQRLLDALMVHSANSAALPIRPRRAPVRR